MKPESLVIAGQHTAVNVFLSLVHTARQATKVGGPEVAMSTACGDQCRRSGLSRNKVALGNLWLDHLLSKDNLIG